MPKTTEDTLETSVLTWLRNLGDQSGFARTWSASNGLTRGWIPCIRVYNSLYVGTQN